jgi:uncharacterized protein (DUF488 family)
MGIEPRSNGPFGRLRENHPTTQRDRGITIFTIGYERRTAGDLIALLKRAGVKALADIRQKPVSRKPGFGAKGLRTLCESAGIAYEPYPQLGSTHAQRGRVKETGDIATFHKEFRSYSRRHMQEPLARLIDLVKARPTALLCYERSHKDCHRMDIADLLAEQTGAAIVAIE